MTHPNVEYFESRVKLAEEKTEEVKNAIVAVMAKTEDEYASEVCQKAYGRLYANLELTKTLLDRIKDYEERIALLS